MQHFQKQKQTLAYRCNYSGGGARGVCTIFAIFFGLCSWQRHSLCLVWCCGRDKATIVNNFIRDLYTTHLSSPSPLPNSIPSLSRLLLATNCINGQSAPFWVAFKVLFHFIAISIFNWFCFISRFMCVFLFCCAQTRTHTQWENAICCAFFWFSFAIAVCRLLIANCLVSLTLWLRSVLAVYLASQSGQPGQPASQSASHSLRPHLLFAFLLHSPWLA